MSFLTSVTKLLDDFEMEESNEPTDAGGYTRWGFASKANPDLDVKNLTREQAIDLYQERYWLPLRCQQLDPQVAQIVFFFGVNAGVKRAAAVFQDAVNHLLEWPHEIEIDGRIGNQTMLAYARVVKKYRGALLATLVRKIDEYYNRLADKDLVYGAPNRRGWLNRLWASTELSA